MSGKHRKLLMLAVATAALTFFLIGLGNVVTRTQSGLGCGDHWPTCNGKWIPDLTNIHVVIEFFHRVAAALVGFFTLFLTVGVWMVQDRSFAGSVRNISLYAILLLAAQIVIGGITVRMELPPLVVVLHNGVSIAFFGTLVVLTGRIYQFHRGTAVDRENSGANEGGQAVSLPFLSILSLLVFGQILLGAYVRQSGSRTGCTAMIPFCEGYQMIPPADWTAVVHFSHRTLGMLIGVLLVVLLVQALRRVGWSLLTTLAIIECFLVVLQITSGLLSVWTEETYLVIWSTIHLLSASLIFGTLLAMVVHATPAARGTATDTDSLAMKSQNASPS